VIDVVKEVFGTCAVPHSVLEGYNMDLQQCLQTWGEPVSGLLEKLIPEAPTRSIVSLTFDDYARTVEKAKAGFSSVSRDKHMEMFNSYRMSTLKAMGISRMPEPEFRSSHPGHITDRRYGPEPLGKLSDMYAV
jgi:hypothetical protein